MLKKIQNDRNIQSVPVMQYYSQLIGSDGMTEKEVYKDNNPPIYRGVVEDLGWDPRKGQMGPAQKAWLKEERLKKKGIVQPNT